MEAHTDDLLAHSHRVAQFIFIPQAEAPDSVDQCRSSDSIKEEQNTLITILSTFNGLRQIAYRLCLYACGLEWICFDRGQRKQRCIKSHWTGPD